MKKREADAEQWETPSLQWIHQVRRQRQAKRKGHPLRPISRQEAERLAKRYGLKSVPPITVEH